MEVLRLQDQHQTHNKREPLCSEANKESHSKVRQKREPLSGEEGSHRQVRHR